MKKNDVERALDISVICTQLSWIWHANYFYLENYARKDPITFVDVVWILVPYLGFLFLFDIVWSRRPINDNAVSFAQEQFVQLPRDVRLVSVQSDAFVERSGLFFRHIGVPSGFEPPPPWKVGLTLSRLHHEIGHIKSRDILSIYVYSISIVMAVSISARILWARASLDYAPLGIESISFLIATLLAMPLVILFRLIFVIRNREFRADFYAFSKIGMQYIDYLRHKASIEGMNKPKSAIVYLANRLTHPSFATRLQKLRSNDYTISDCIINGIMLAILVNSLSVSMAILSDVYNDDSFWGQNLHIFYISGLLLVGISVSSYLFLLIIHIIHGFNVKSVMPIIAFFFSMRVFSYLISWILV